MRIKRILFLILAMIIFYISSYSLKPDEYAVIRQFGKIIKIDNESGLGFKVPIIHKVTKLPSNNILYDIKATELNTKDKKRIVVDYYILWKIKDPEKMLTLLTTIENAELRLANTIYSVVRTELGKVTFDNIINKEKGTRQEIDSTIQVKVEELLNKSNDGIELVDIRLKKVELPEENLEAVYSKMISERKIKAQDYRSQGDSESLRIRSEVDREVKTMISDAERKAEEIKASAEAEAGKIYNEAYGKDPNFYKLYMTLDSYSSLKNDTIFVLPNDSEYVKFLTE